MNKFYSIVSVLGLAIALTGCDQSSTGQNASEIPLMSIDVAKVQRKDAQSWFTYTTRLEAPERVVLVPRVSGLIEQVLFKEGGHVEKGQVLFTIDRRPFEAEVARLEAQLISAESVLRQAKSEADRAKRLLSKSAMSTEQADQRDAALRQAIAGRSAIQAQLKLAQLNLEFTQVKSPISGVVSRAVTTRGNYVTAGVTQLTTLVSDDKLYAYFDIDERTWNASFADITDTDELPIALNNVSGKHVAYGMVDFIDNEINTTTGTLRIRGVFDTNSYDLKPGAFARVEIATREPQKQLIVPERSVGTDLKNRFVLTVDDNNTLQYRAVQLGERYGAFRAIISGLEEGERIAVNGPARVGPGMPIKPNTVALDFDDTQFVINEYVDKSTLLSAAN